MSELRRRPISRDVLLAIGLLAFAAWAIGKSLTKGLRSNPEPYGRRENWTSPTGGEINYSAYTFRDRNRDGILNLGDRPLVDIVVEMTGPRGARARQRSNSNGFVNFPMSRSILRLGAKIRRPGDYRFRVLCPPGWIITSGNAEQTSRFEELPGAVGDLISVRPTAPIGLAPRLTISSRLLRREASGATVPTTRATLVATAPSGSPIEAQVGPDGDFEIEATPGLWRLSVRDARTGAGAERDVAVSDVPVRLAAIVLGDEPRSSAPRRKVIDFEGLATAGVTKMPNGFEELDWDYLNAIERTFAGGEGYSNGITSGHFVAYSSSGHPVTITSSRPFDFFGAYFAAAWRQAEGETLLVEATRQGELVAEERVELSSLGPVWFQADFRGVDRVVLRTARYWQFVVDDLAIGLAEETSP